MLACDSYNDIIVAENLTKEKAITTLEQIKADDSIHYYEIKKGVIL
jgi:hypothetical protein